MCKLLRTLPIIVLALAITAIPWIAQAQSNPPTRSVQSAEEKTAQGELIKVDSENHTLVIRGAENSEMEFHYNSETKVVGVTNGVQGLSTKTGSRLMVQYKEEIGEKLATKIEILKVSPNR